MMSETHAVLPLPTTDSVLELAYSRLSACPEAARPDLSACLGYLRAAKEVRSDAEADNTALEHYYNRAITLASKGLDRREDRALSLMVMAITGIRDNTPSSTAQAARTLRQIRMPVEV